MTTANQGAVLVVDDDADIRETLQGLLESEGFAVQLVDNAADAIHYLDEHIPCAILVDMVMPGIIGTSLLDYLKQDARLAHVPVAVVSGSPQMAPGGYRVFTKPIDIKALLEFVRSEGCTRVNDHRVTRTGS